MTIVYISHRMEEVFELADRVSVLRDGTLVGTRNIGETNENELVALMINRSIEQIYHKEQFPLGRDDPRGARPLRQGLRGCLDDGPRGRDRRALRADRRRPQRIRHERSSAATRKTAGEILLEGQAGQHPQRAARRSSSASRWRRKAGATRVSASTCRSASTSTCRSTSA